MKKNAKGNLSKTKGAKGKSDKIALLIAKHDDPASTGKPGKVHNLTRWTFAQGAVPNVAERQNRAWEEKELALLVKFHKAGLSHKAIVVAMAKEGYTRSQVSIYMTLSDKLHLTGRGYAEAHDIKRATGQCVKRTASKPMDDKRAEEVREYGNKIIASKVKFALA